MRDATDEQVPVDISVGHASHRGALRIEIDRSEVLLLLHLGCPLLFHLFQEFSLLLQILCLHILSEKSDLVLTALLIVLVLGSSQLHQVALLSEFATALLVVKIMLLEEEIILTMRLKVPDINFESLASHENVFSWIATSVQYLEALHGDHASR